MNGHRISARMPRAGGEWTRDPCRAQLRHRGGNPWQKVRIPRRLHRCAPQTALVWSYRTERGSHTAAVLWCGCGAATYPGAGGRWAGRNLRRACPAGDFPAWHRNLANLEHPTEVHARLDATTEVPNVDAISGGWRRAGDGRVAAGGELVRPALPAAS